MDNQDVINDLLGKVRNDFINSLQSKGQYATGETISNLIIATTPDYGALYAPWWIDALEIGRLPTRQGAPTGDPTLFEQIEKWIEAKGLPLNPYAVTKKIHKYGYPGKPGVLTEPLALADKHIDEACEQIAENMQKEIVDLFKVFD